MDRYLSGRSERSGDGRPSREYVCLRIRRRAELNIHRHVNGIYLINRLKVNRAAALQLLAIRAAPASRVHGFSRDLLRAPRRPPTTYPKCDWRTCSSISGTVALISEQPGQVHWNTIAAFA